MRLQRLFTVLLLLDGYPIEVRSDVSHWRPDRLVLHHSAPGLFIEEIRCVVEDCFVSRLEIIEAPGDLDVIQWSLQDVRAEGQGTPWQSAHSWSSSSDASNFVWRTRWPRELEPDRTAVEAEQLESAGDMLPPLDLSLSLFGSQAPSSWLSLLAQRHDDAPAYRASALPEFFRDGSLPSKQIESEWHEGLLHIYRHYRVAPGETISLGARWNDAISPLLDISHAPEESERQWLAFFEGVPHFESSDAYLNAAYWYRWYGLRLNLVATPLPLMTDQRAEPSPFIAEGIGFFRNFITYSAQTHLRELAWMSSPALAQGVLRNLRFSQRADGSFPGHNYFCRPSRDFYHADFTSGLETLEALHPGSVSEEDVAVQERYGRYMLAERMQHSEGPTLYEVFDQNETGQEYMSRYQFVNERADQWESFRVGGIDASVYACRLFRFLSLRVPDPVWARELSRGLAGLAGAYHEDFFCDRAATGEFSPARPATGFYVYLLSSDDMAEVGNLGAPIGRWMLNPSEFWLEGGFPATAKSDPTFSAEGIWKGRRTNCPWNGRSWPMTNSHLVDVLANYARTVDESAREDAGAAVMKAIKLLFHGSDSARPCCYEHYNPETGEPALYRGYDDYMHSWVVDLILRHVVGVSPGLTDVDPLPMGLQWVKCTNIPHPEGKMSVLIHEGTAQVVVEEG